MCFQRVAGNRGIKYIAFHFQGFDLFDIHIDICFTDGQA